MKKLRRDIGLLGLLYAGLAGIVGSGWLFSSSLVTRRAGPLSIYVWLLAAVMIIVIALVYAELGPLFPRSGALVHMTQVGHGFLFGRIWSWILILSYVALPPVEVIAIVTYANNYFSGLLESGTHVLTAKGFFVSTFILFLVVFGNFFAIRWVVRINNSIMLWKLLIPFLTIVVFLSISFHPINLRLEGETFTVSDIFTTMVSAGVTFSFFGFRNSIELAGESRRPARDIPLATIGAIIIALLLYIGLQYAFMLAIPPVYLTSWSDLTFPGIAGPLAGVATVIGLAWWGWILYVDAFVSPFGTAYIYATITSRIIMAAGETQTAPTFVRLLNKRGVPWVALIFTFLFGFIFLFPFPSWQKMVSYVSFLNVLSYSIGPIFLLQLRYCLPHMNRPFRLPCAIILAPLAFFICNFLIFLSGFKAINFLFCLLLLFFVIYLCWNYFVKNLPTEQFGWSFVWWIFPYFAGLWLIARLGPTLLGGNGHFSLGFSVLFIFILSIFILLFALKSGISKESVVERVKYVNSLQSFGEQDQNNFGRIVTNSLEPDGSH